MSPDDANLSPTDSPTAPTNNVTILDMSGTIVGVSYNGVYMVSDGQPSNPPPLVTPESGYPGNFWNIEFDAGRQDTTPVADKFNGLCGSAANEFSGTPNLGSSPKQLNFFFGVNFTLQSGGNSQTVTAYLGQGNNDWQNNWWIGGDCISSEGALSAWLGPDLIALSLQGNGAGFLFGNPNADGPTRRPNVVTLVDNSGTIVGVTPNGQWMVTNGQPMNTPPTVTPNLSSTQNTFNIELDAGRQDSGPVAEQFNTLCGGAANEWGISTVTDSSPSQLNFFFGIDVKLMSGGDGIVVPLYLGQGSSGTGNNNWWIGGKYISDSGQLSVDINGQTVTLNMQSSGSNEFIFNLATPSE